MSNFIKEIKKIAELSSETEDMLGQQLQTHSYSKGKLLLKEGEICRRVWFIDQGAARVYYLNEDKEVTDWIGLENSFILSIPSFFLQTPSQKIIELLEDSRLSSISYQSLEQLYSQSHTLERMGRKIANFALMLMSKRVEEVLFKTSMERYEILLRNHPEILRRIPLKIVASYLGMTQETLSRMRSRI